MSASIYWRPTSVGKTYITPCAPSSFLTSLGEAFGGGYDSWPDRLDISHCATLRGLAAGLQGDQREAAQALIEAIEKYGEIEVGTDY